MQSRIVIRITSWPLYRDTYRIVTLLVIHSTSRNDAPKGLFTGQNTDLFMLFAR